MSLPANVDTSHAKLPASYEQAKTALAECAGIDECQSWADKAAALSSYAKQAEDNTLHAYAQRIRARAIRRAGELLKQIPPNKGGDASLFDARDGGDQSATEPRDSGDPKLTRKNAAADAGMSERQMKTALRVANVPAQSFEAQVESPRPPTVTALSEQGKLPARTQPPKKDFDAATYAVAALRTFVQEARRYDPEQVAAGLMQNEITQARQLVAEADSWLDRFVVNLEGSSNEK